MILWKKFKSLDDKKCLKEHKSSKRTPRILTLSRNIDQGKRKTQQTKVEFSKKCWNNQLYRSYFACELTDIHTLFEEETLHIEIKNVLTKKRHGLEVIIVYPQFLSYPLDQYYVFKVKLFSKQLFLIYTFKNASYYFLSKIIH